MSTSRQTETTVPAAPAASEDRAPLERHVDPGTDQSQPDTSARSSSSPDASSSPADDDDEPATADDADDAPAFHYLPESGAGPPLNAPVTDAGKRSAALLQASRPPPMYVCAQCGIQLGLQDEIVSKAFSGREGKAYLFHTCLNARIGAPEERQLLTGMHTVADVRCGCCGALVGWTYLRAFEASQKYKEGRFILEEGAVHKVNHWE